MRTSKKGACDQSPSDAFVQGFALLEFCRYAPIPATGSEGADPHPAAIRRPSPLTRGAHQRSDASARQSAARERARHCSRRYGAAEVSADAARRRRSRDPATHDGRCPRGSVVPSCHGRRIAVRFGSVPGCLLHCDAVGGFESRHRWIRTRPIEQPDACCVQLKEFVRPIALIPILGLPGSMRSRGRLRPAFLTSRHRVDGDAMTFPVRCTWMRPSRCSLTRSQAFRFGALVPEIDSGVDRPSLLGPRAQLILGRLDEAIWILCCASHAYR